MFEGSLSTQVLNAEFIASAYFFFLNYAILKEIKNQRKLACHVFQMHHFTHRLDNFLLLLEELRLW